MRRGIETVLWIKFIHRRCCECSDADCCLIFSGLLLFINHTEFYSNSTIFRRLRKLIGFITHVNEEWNRSLHCAAVDAIG